MLILPKAVNKKQTNGKMRVKVLATPLLKEEGKHCSQQTRTLPSVCDGPGLWATHGPVVRAAGRAHVEPVGRGSAGPLSPLHPGLTPSQC